MKHILLAIVGLLIFSLNANAIGTTSEMVGNNLVVTITFLPTDQAWMNNDLLSIPDWVDGGAKGKLANCRTRMIKQWDQILRDDPTVESIPTSQVSWLTLVLARDDYYDRVDRDMKVVAEKLVKLKLDELVALGYAGLPSSNGTTTNDYDTVTGYLEYKRVSVLQVDTPSAGIKTITVTVYWDADDHSVSDTAEVVE